MSVREMDVLQTTISLITEMQNGGISTAEETTLSPYDQHLVDIMTAIREILLVHVRWAIFAFGVPGNILLFLVMIRRKNRTSSTCIYMAMLAIVDTGALFGFLGIPNIMWRAGLIGQVLSCTLVGFFNNLFTSASCWIVVVMTVDRFIVVRWPLKAGEWCSPARAKRSLFAVCMFCILFNFHYWFTNDYVCDHVTMSCRCTGYAFGIEFIVTLIRWSDFVVNAVIPIFILVVMNVLILKAYRKAFSLRAELHQTADNKDTKESRKEAAQANHLTRMLLIVSITFIITVTPHRIARSVDSAFPQTTLVGKIVMQTYRTLNHRVWFLNNAINFYLYVVGGGQRFRRDLKMIFLCGVRGRTNSERSTSTGYA